MDNDFDTPLKYFTKISEIKTIDDCISLAETVLATNDYILDINCIETKKLIRMMLIDLYNAKLAMTYMQQILNVSHCTFDTILEVMNNYITKREVNNEEIRE